MLVQSRRACQQRGEAAAGGRPPCADGWLPLVGVNSTNGGQTIGTHHIDIVNTTARFVRLRLLQVLRTAAAPLISFRVLRVAR